MGLLASMAPISAPSVSLEGKNIWILRSMPISGADILKAKLRFHCIASVPVAAIGALVLGIVYEVGWFETIFMVIGTVLLFVLTGVLGLVFNMCFPRLDWANEAGPVKQSMAVFFSMFGMMFISAGYVGLYFGFTALLGGAKNSLLAFSMVNVLFIFVIYFFYLLMVKWGGKKFETL
jgi:ABC-2 type transport system permease protein